MELSIIFLPLIASIISGFFGKLIGDRNSEIVTSVLVKLNILGKKSGGSEGTRTLDLSRDRRSL